jgi:PadR family transcriptional regulator PadR
MDAKPRLTTQTIGVLSALMTNREMSGAEIAKVSELASGTLYPILYRLEKAGWLDSRWEAGEPTRLGRPRRRYYWITAVGQKQIADVVRDLQPAGARLSWTR